MTMSSVLKKKILNSINIFVIFSLILFLILTFANNYFLNFTEFQHKSNKCQLKNGLSYDSSQKTYPFTIVTGASSDHYCALQSWLYYTSLSLSPIPEFHRPRIIVYDLGLVNFQRNALNYLHQKNYFTHYKLFNFLKYPSFWNISISKGEYAWKPAIIAETFREFPGIVLWLDSGTFVSTDFLMNVEKLVNAYDGFFSPKSNGNLLKWTHPGVFKYFNDSTKKTKYKKSINCNAATLLFDTSRVSHIIKEWENCAHKKECIAPNGSNRTNHRQDQAILSYLMIKNNRNCDNYGIQFGIRTHMDKYCAQMIWEYEEIYGEFWSPNAQDLKEMKEIIENFPELSIYDIWTKSGKDAILEEIKKSGNYSLKLGDVF